MAPTFGAMGDLIYVLITSAFFGLMRAYVLACRYLGKEPTGEEERT